MVEFVVVKDPHICVDVKVPAGRNSSNFYDVQLGKLGFINRYCRENGVGYLVSTGDNLNYKNSGLYGVNSINSLIRAFGVLGGGLRFFSVAGNHDLSRSSREMKGRSVYNILLSAGCWEDLHGSGVDLGGGVVLSGLDYNGDFGSFKDELFELDSCLDGDRYNVVVLHEFVVPDGDSVPYCKFLNYSDFVCYKNIDLVVVGHIHKGFGYGEVVCDNGRKCGFVNPWSMTRLSRDYYAVNELHKPELVHVVVGDGGVDCKFVEIPHGRFSDSFVTGDVEVKKSVGLDIGDFVRSLSDFKGVMGDGLDMSGLDKDVRVVLEEYLERVGEV